MSDVKVKERPILMTPENAQKCRDGRKTMTRRLNGLDEINENPESWDCTLLDIGDAIFLQRPRIPQGHRQIKCPYGTVGDRLWVREAWRMSGEYADVSTTKIQPEDAWLYVDHLRYRGENHSEGVDKWRSSMMMPRWACRTWLEITDIRVERLQEITEEDAKAEGAAFVCELCGQDLDTVHGAEVHWACDDPDCERASYREGFRRLWESINGPGSWDLNPWVWVIGFQKVRTA